jgi:hypothetical protein
MASSTALLLHTTHLHTYHHFARTMSCSQCNHSPCKAHLYKEALESELISLSESPVDNSKKRNHLYSCFVFSEHGRLGRRHRIRIPECVVSFIRSICPDENNQYTGHRDIDDDDNTADDGGMSMNDSFASVLPDDVLGPINFNRGERVKVCVSFENEIFPIEYVRDFVNHSPVEGWQVTFAGEHFTNATMICSSIETWREIYVYCLMNDNEYTQIVHHKI